MNQTNGAVMFIDATADRLPIVLTFKKWYNTVESKYLEV